MMREYDINLIPDDILERDALILRGKTWLFFAGGVLLFLLLLNLAIKLVNNNTLKEINLLSESGQKISEGQLMVKEIQIKEQELARMRDTVVHLSQRGPVVSVFSSIDQAINRNIVLTRLEINAPFSYAQKAGGHENNNNGYFNNGPSARPAGGKDNVLIMRGMAQSNSDLAAMLTVLSKDDIYSSVNLRYSRSGDIEEGMPVSFEIECLLNNEISHRSLR